MKRPLQTACGSGLILHARDWSRLQVLLVEPGKSGIDEREAGGDLWSLNLSPQSGSFVTKMTVSSYRFYTERSISFYSEAGKIYSLCPEAQTHSHTPCLKKINKKIKKSKLANLSKGICCPGVQPAGKHTHTASSSINHTNSQMDTHIAYCSCHCRIVIEALFSSLCHLLCFQSSPAQLHTSAT